jgi:ketosteroid isomerase-like protein
MRVLPLAAWLPLFLGCAPAPDPERELATLMAADRSFDSTVAVRGLEGWVESFGDSGMQFDSRGSPVVGHEAIRDHMRRLLTDTTRSLRWQPDRAGVSDDGSLGYTFGTWRLLARGPQGEQEIGHGRYQTTWRRQPDGSWKVEADIGNESRGE